MSKLLILRLSSFGDIVQCLPVAEQFKKVHPNSEVHWVVRSDFKEIVGMTPSVDRVWTLWRHEGIRGLLRLSRELRTQGYTHVYDAHNNLRSNIIGLFLLSVPNRVRRSKNRIKRALLFNLRINRFEVPFRGRVSFLRPLEKWGVLPVIETLPTQFPLHVREKVDHLLGEDFKNFVALAPSAAWEMKRWPLEFWHELVFQMKDVKFLILGGASDTFCKELVPKDSETQDTKIGMLSPRVINAAGAFSLLESCYAVSLASAVVSGDTGTLHVADVLGRPTLALIGPTAFGYPAAATSKTLEVELSCKPCSKDGRGRCVNSVYQRCMKEISPHLVIMQLKKLISRGD